MMPPRPASAPRPGTPIQRWALTLAGLVFLAGGTYVVHVRHSARTEATLVHRLHADTALMAAGIRVDRHSIALARARGDHRALREAEQSLRARELRLATDLATLRTANGSTARTDSVRTPRPMAVRPY